MTASGVHSLVVSHGTHAHSSVLVRAELLYVIDVLYVDLVDCHLLFVKLCSC